MHDYNITCSYDEALQLKTLAAISATTDKNLCAISDSNAGMIQTVVDNFDADISSQNGKVSTHSLAMLMTQSESSSSDDIDVSETIQRTPKSDMAKPI
ncbi:hypothetical protein DPMN_182473 [Dreissena polymorpha]|uniref:Uncharacterized protein n=1 Tax=Dreissena polymorpha TaxID=45954 RepID=A0A9D4DFP2_DREPO|nr:hypothetical protein DPMN_182473 [Dreissena polymorpha]